MLCVVGASSTVLAQAFKPGEKITYNVLQMGVKVGEATLTFVGEKAYENQKALLIVFQSKGLTFFDEEKIYLNPLTFKPLAVERDLDIFGNKEKINERYSQGSVKIFKDAAGKRIEQTIDKAGGMDNIYAFIYRYRQSGAFKMNERFDVHLPTKDITIQLKRQVDLNNIAGQNYRAFYMESDPAKYKLWFDASDKKLPLRISSAIGMANTVMVMTGYEN
ncbi:MAG: DUF3108 domain-containing protein [Candidatus Omnitrophica bacterium]|nr:DUF3108 domain-containing protein [Candidatus Omnitrophota bacterium]